MLADPLEGIVGGGLVDVVVDRHLRAMFSELQRDPTTDAP